MSAAIVPPFEAGLEFDTNALPRKRFTRADVDRMTAARVFEDQRYELIDGDLIDKMGQKPTHAAAIQLLMAAFVRVMEPLRVRVQLAMEASAADRARSLPEPDIAILHTYKSEFGSRHPHGEECLVVIEVSDTTVSFDLGRKAELYAAAGVPEYWVLDLKRRMLIVHRQPEDGVYRAIQLLAERDTVSMESYTLEVASLLPPA